jgi:hypothetical protein
MNPIKMSDIFKEMAMTVLKKPNSIPSSEAAHAALLLSHVAWNRSIGQVFNHNDCESLLREFEKSRPKFWTELKTRNWEALVDDLISYKKQHYPTDNRIVVVCGMREDNIHIDWQHPEEIKDWPNTADG